MKVLLSAYSCQPGRGSEPGIGWNWVRQAARFHEVWVLTRSGNREVIEAHLAQKPQANLRFVYHDIPAQQWLSKCGPLVRWLVYYLWQISAYCTAKKLHRSISFDIVHHITFGTWRVPSFLWKLSIPFIWGPVGGGENWPGTLLPTARFGVRSYESLRLALQRFGRFDPNIRATARAATIAIGANRETAALLSRLGCRRVCRFSAANVVLSDSSKSSTRKTGDRINLLTACLLEPRKGLDLAIRALAAAGRKHELRYTIYGNGPEMKRLRRLVRRQGLNSSVQMPGMVERKQLLKAYEDNDIFLFPSLRDSGGMAVLEAMSLGKPVICLDLGGPGEFITEECGIKVRPGTEKQVVRDLSIAIERLSGNPGLRESMGKAGRRRVAEVYDWEIRGKQLAGIYEQAVSNFKKP